VQNEGAIDPACAPCIVMYDKHLQHATARQHPSCGATHWLAQGGKTGGQRHPAAGRLM
jgi:hypothetical protein